jgi:hypothetical protein
MSFLEMKYRLEHWFFQWRVDDEGDITFTLAGILNFIKYKEHTIIGFCRGIYYPAPKYFGKE